MSDASDHWPRIDALCQAALQRPDAERRAFLLEACDDPDVRGEVESLLAHASAAEPFLELPVGAAAASVLPDALTPFSGTRVGVFEIGVFVGAGGMGEVYRARDTLLDRDVALKILPLAFALDRDRLDRFRREAQALASLNHPNVGAIYGFEATDGVYALVLEFVDGPTLADRLEHGPIPVDEACSIARQMTEALESAHEHGIVHNDLKPSNVKLRPDGTVKVLDFGLATVVQATIGGASGSTPTTSLFARPTFGTPAYASPEQLKGIGDKRSDIWAFGAVLYEMLSGKPAFPEDGDACAVANLDGSALPASTPESMRHLIRRCLDPDVRRRLRDIGEARIVLEDPTMLGALAQNTGSVPDRKAVIRRRFPLRAAAMIGGGALAGAVMLGALVSRPATPEVVRLSFVLPGEQSLSTGDRSIAAISPDGKEIVYVAAPAGLYLRSLSASESKPIPALKATPTSVSRCSRQTANPSCFTRAPIRH
jgi:eukaryotic-like serine/threonine-protein kinase